MKKVTTTCPACKTSFRVTPQQLAARQGQVRCGHCNTLFNGLETLAMADQSLGAQPVAVSTIPSTPTAPRLIERKDPIAIKGVVASATVEPDAPILYRPDFKPLPDVNRKLWMSGSAFLLILLLLQCLTYFRDSLARDVPTLKPFLSAYCAVTGCEIVLSRNADLITIESSDLQQFPNRPNEILLTALLRNRANYEQALPSLELTLTDATDQALAKRVFHPADYVQDKSAINHGVATLQEVNVRLRLELIDLTAVGYRLFVFYP